MRSRIQFITVFLILQALIAFQVVFATISSERFQSLTARLENWDVEEAWPEVQEALARQPQDPELLSIASLIAYNRGEYKESLELMKRSLEMGGEIEEREGFALFIEQTMRVLAPYRRYETPHFIISLDERRDGILIDYLTDSLEKTYTVMAQRYGFTPKEKVRVELFPDAEAFYLASALSKRDIEVTGAVGLTKFNKLQFLSPRALVHGYRWLDAISHEYVHYLIVKMTSNKAPIWFHEGLAKYEETQWRNGPSYLSQVYETLLAEALAGEKLIGFKKMEPSLIRLETPEEVQLAYAQAASAIEFITLKVGHEGLKKIMDRMFQAKMTGAGESIKEVLGVEFSEFEEQWTAYLSSKELRPRPGTSLPRFRVREGEMDGERMDLEEIKSLVARNRAHLGDRLKARGRTGAAVIEYQRALSETREAVPVMYRLSAALIGLDRDEEALNILKRTLELAPDHPTPYVQLGRVYLKMKDYQQARSAFEVSIQINPFNPEIHIGLSNAYGKLGDDIGAAREREIAYRLGR